MISPHGVYQNSLHHCCWLYWHFAIALPRLRIEPTGGGSIFYIHNGHSEALTAYLIELVNYPGSSYTLWQDDPANAIPAGGDKKIQVANMTVGAVPDYVKMTAAIFADGTTAGIPAKVTGMLGAARPFSNDA